MIEAGIVISGLLIVCAIYGAYLIGKSVGEDVRKRQAADLVTERAVRHNLNCLVCDLRHDLEFMTKKRDNLGKLLTRSDEEHRELRADALAFNYLKGQWVTDKKHLLAYNSRPEGFICIGYPERRL